jgi:hypothetical protein
MKKEVGFAYGTPMTRDAFALGDELRNEIRQLVRAKLGKLRIRDVEIRPGYDYDGDQVIYVDVYYELSDQAIDPEVTLEALVALKNGLSRAGEDRFPYLRHHFDEHQKVKGFA